MGCAVAKTQIEDTELVFVRRNGRLVLTQMPRERTAVEIFYLDRTDTHGIILNGDETVALEKWLGPAAHCRTCRWWTPYQGDAWGTCSRNTPERSDRKVQADVVPFQERGGGFSVKTAADFGCVMHEGRKHG